jgi:hypothetical protein
MDKIKALFKRKDKKESSTAGTKTDTNGTATAIPKPTPTDTAAAPSTSDPAAPPAGEYTQSCRDLNNSTDSSSFAGAAPVDAGAPADPAPANTPAAK